MSLTTTPGYVRCAMPFGANDHCDFAANDHCDFAAMHATIHHLIYLLSSPVPQQYLEIFADIYINLDEL